MTTATTNPTTNTGFALEYNQVENTKPYMKFATTITTTGCVKQLAKCKIFYLERKNCFTLCLKC